MRRGRVGGGGRYGRVGSNGRNVCTARKDVLVCGVKKALQTAKDRKVREKREVGEKIHLESEKNTKMPKKINTIIRFSPIFPHIVFRLLSLSRPLT